MSTGERMPRIVPADSERIDELEPLWLTLHRHHRTVARIPIEADDARSWALRSALYRAILNRGAGFLLIAERDETPCGYAMVETRGADDTYGFADGYAEVLTLVVAETERGKGIGSSLLDAVDAELMRRGIRDQMIAVMVGNDDAQRLYERRGFRAGELSLFRATAE